MNFNGKRISIMMMLNICACCMLSTLSEKSRAYAHSSRSRTSCLDMLPHCSFAHPHFHICCNRFPHFPEPKRLPNDYENTSNWVSRSVRVQRSTCRDWKRAVVSRQLGGKLSLFLFHYFYSLLLFSCGEKEQIIRKTDWDCAKIIIKELNAGV
jgi:hypothetical protein